MKKNIRRARQRKKLWEANYCSRVDIPETGGETLLRRMTSLKKRTSRKEEGESSRKKKKKKRHNINLREKIVDSLKREKTLQSEPPEKERGAGSGTKGMFAAPLGFCRGEGKRTGIKGKNGVACDGNKKALCSGGHVSRGYL